MHMTKNTNAGAAAKGAQNFGYGICTGSAFLANDRLKKVIQKLGDDALSGQMLAGNKVQLFFGSHANEHGIQFKIMVWAPPETKV